MATPQRHDNLVKDLEILARQDPQIAEVLARIGAPEPRISEPGFASLLKIIVGQQVSTASAAAIWQRLSDIETVTADGFARLDDDTLGRIGFSRAKMRYGRALAGALIDGRLDLDRLVDLPAEATMRTLTAVPGIGRWSAEIYRMFALGDRDVFPSGDLALREAVRLLRGWEHRPDLAATDAAAEAWKPKRSAAALLLWRLYRHERGIAVLGADSADSP